jgi:Tfp pilus assembly protein PilX
MNHRLRVAARRVQCDERGVALLIALMAILLTMALGTALILGATIEARITRNFRMRTEALYAADAVLERAVADLRAIPDWNAALTGLVSSSFVDGPPNSVHVLADGQRIDQGELVNQMNCRQSTPCSSAAMDTDTAERPWGPNNPRWQPFAWGHMSGLLPVESPFYLLAMIADDPSENDSDPLRDGSSPCVQGRREECNPGTARVSLRAEAFGPFGAHKVLEATISRSGTGVHILSWRERR